MKQYVKLVTPFSLPLTSCNSTVQDDDLPNIPPGFEDLITMIEQQEGDEDPTSPSVKRLPGQRDNVPCDKLKILRARQLIQQSEYDAQVGSTLATDTPSIERRMINVRSKDGIEHLLKQSRSELWNEPVEVGTEWYCAVCDQVAMHQKESYYHPKQRNELMYARCNNAFCVDRHSSVAGTFILTTEAKKTRNDERPEDRP